MGKFEGPFAEPTIRYSDSTTGDNLKVVTTEDKCLEDAEGALRWPDALYRVNGSKADGEAALALVLRHRCPAKRVTHVPPLASLTSSRRLAGK